MGRITALDGLRGACLVLMLVSHLHFDRTYALGFLHFRELGFADSAQAFIFLSGLLVGLTGWSQLHRAGPTALRVRLHGRALQLYSWHLGLLVLVLVGTRSLPWAWFAWDDWLGALFRDDTAYALATVAMVYQPTLMDVLPQYILYMLVAPFLLRAIAAGWAAVVVTASGLLWLSVQLGLHLPLTAALDRGFAALGADVVPHSGFNPLGWQLLFVGGLVLGAGLASGRLQPARLLDPQRPALPVAATLVLAWCAGWRLALDLGVVGEPVMALLQAYGRRLDLGIIYVVNFAAFAYLIAWLLAVAPTSGTACVRALGASLDRLVHQPWLTMIGRHSMPVFAYHVILVYALKYADTYWGPIGDPWFSLIALAAIVSLAVPAVIAERRRVVPEPAPAAT